MAAAGSQRPPLGVLENSIHTQGLPIGRDTGRYPLLPEDWPRVCQKSSL